MQASGAPQLLPCGDAALVVQFGEEIDPGLNARVLALDTRVAAGLTGVIETVPTYRSLLVHYDPTATDFRTLGAALLALCRDPPQEPAQGRLWRIPVVYGGDFGIDLESVAAHHGITTGELIRKHSAPAYRVYMMGFLPGFPYMGTLPPELELPRRENPRLRVPSGSVAIAMAMSTVYTLESPGGWHLLGRTPVLMWDPRRAEPTLVAAGDKVTFTPVSRREYEDILAQSTAGTYDVRPDGEARA